MTEQQSSIDRNVACTIALRDLIDVAESMCHDGGYDPAKFWTGLHVMAADRGGLTDTTYRPQKNELTPMTDAEARGFGKQRMTFGKHAGKRVDDVEMQYLEWLADSDGTKFSLNLLRYLKSERIRREQQ